MRVSFITDEMFFTVEGQVPPKGAEIYVFDRMYSVDKVIYHINDGVFGRMYEARVHLVEG